MESSFFNNLGGSSLDRVELVTAPEEALDIETPNEDAEKIRSVEDAISDIRKRGKGGK